MQTTVLGSRSAVLSKACSATPLPSCLRAPVRACPAAGRTPVITVAVASEPKPAALLARYDAADLDDAGVQEATARPRINLDSILDTVKPIVADVQKDGDAAVKAYTSKFDKVDLESVCVPIDELPDPVLPPEHTAAFDQAYENIKAFHAAQTTPPLTVETMPGVVCRREARPIGRVGIYVPGGTAVLPSSTLMLSVPAALAGCSTIVMATPPAPDGSITPEVLYCAKKAGVTHVLKAGGAQAVAAMAWGTESCPKVDKIAGPGNQFVTAAKMLLQNSEAMVAIDMPAGPSEVLVIADKDAPLAHVAADLLSQAEHGRDSQSVLLALPGVDLDALEAEMEAQVSALPRQDIAREALSHSCVVQVKDQADAMRVSNLYAPEHLIINVAESEQESWIPLVKDAGSVFLGRWTPESVGDYASGTNHTLPTYGYARMYSGVSLDTFQKMMTIQSLTKAGLDLLGPTVATMAEVEGLEAHRRAVTLRMESQ